MQKTLSSTLVLLEIMPIRELVLLAVTVQVAAVAVVRVATVQVAAVVNSYLY